MHKQKPVNLNLLTIKFPITAIISILHRLSGLLLFLTMPMLLLLLGRSLHSEDYFAEVYRCFSYPLSKFFIWVILSALIYHLIAGIRHVAMDCGYGDSLQGGRFGAKLVLALAILAIILLGVWIW